ncbi:MAG: hypothetical protein R3268_05845 [Acidiferrobacterales bacterium]|nr:hypothetical protein [Acidiferrobacterales bacterium]
MGGLTEIRYGTLLPAVRPALAQFLGRPELGLKPVVELLGFDAVSRLSKASNSLSAWRMKIDPPSLFLADI